MADLELICPAGPSDTGAYRISWQGPEGAEYVLRETARVGASEGEGSLGRIETDGVATGGPEIGSPETGGPQTGSAETGGPETGDSETGDSETGDSETGDSETEGPETEDLETVDSESGNAESGRTATGDLETGGAQREVDTEGTEPETFEAATVATESRVLYRGADLATTLTGRLEGVYHYRLEVVSSPAGGEVAEGSTGVPIGASALCTVEVAPPPLGLAFAMFGVGLSICVATVALIARGHRRHRRGELG